MVTVGAYLIEIARVGSAGITYALVPLARTIYLGNTYVLVRQHV